MIILGIDPGLHISGFGILKKEKHKTYLLDYGYLQMNPKKSLPERVTLFHNFFKEKIVSFGITDCAIETPFLGKNAQNFLKLGYLRGILYFLTHSHTISLHEFSPREVKMSVTGFGGAGKDQVARVILQLFPTIKNPKKDDVTDALAISLCGLWKSKQNSFF